MHLVLLLQGSHSPGKPGNPGILMEFCEPGKLRENSWNSGLLPGILAE
jgi:hypothetical protein